MVLLFHDYTHICEINFYIQADPFCKHESYTACVQRINNLLILLCVKIEFTRLLQNSVEFEHSYTVSLSDTLEASQNDFLLSVPDRKLRAQSL